VHGPRLDDNRIRQMLRLLEKVLSQRDLLSSFESIVPGDDLNEAD